MAGFANIFYSEVEPGLEAIYTNTAVLGWFLSFQVDRKLSAVTISSHMNTCKKVLEWIEAEVCSWRESCMTRDMGGMLLNKCDEIVLASSL